MIVKKGDGVFLWAVLAVQHLVRGLQNGDDWWALMERLRRLNGDLDGLFDQLLGRIEKEYAQEAALYMRILLLPFSGVITSLSTIAFATDSFGWNPHNEEDKGMTEVRYLQGISRTKHRILATCAGLISAGEDDDLLNIDPLDYDQNADGRVEFVHRSVIDYLEDNENGRTFVTNTAAERAVVMRKFIHSILGRFRLSIQLKRRSRVTNPGLSEGCLLYRIWGLAHAIECQTGAADQSLVVSIHKELEHINAESMKLNPHVSQRHWTYMFDLPIMFNAHCSDNAGKLTGNANDAALFGFSVVWA